jgi:hypothetical protein
MRTENFGIISLEGFGILLLDVLIVVTEWRDIKIIFILLGCEELTQQTLGKQNLEGCRSF